MAVLSVPELQAMRQACSVNGIAVNYNKPEANAVFQAIEDTMRGATVQNAISAAIDGAKAGLTAAQKKAFVTMWARIKLGVDG